MIEITKARSCFKTMVPKTQKQYLTDSCALIQLLLYDYCNLRYFQKNTNIVYYKTVQMISSAIKAAYLDYYRVLRES